MTKAVAANSYVFQAWSDGASRSWAQPAVGASISGGVLTINDAGIFGDRESQSTLWYNNFDSEVLGTKASALATTAPLYVTGSEPTVTDVLSKSGTQALSIDYGTGAFAECGLLFQTPTRSFYHSAWCYVQAATVPPPISPIWKFARAGGGLSSDYYHGVAGDATCYQTLRPSTVDGSMSLQNSDTAYTDNSGASIRSGLTNNYSFDLNAWVYLEYIFLLSDPAGKLNGACVMLANGNPVFGPPYVYGTTTSQAYPTNLTRPYGVRPLTSWMITVFDGISAQSGDTNDYKLTADNMCIDSSLSQVVMANAATYEGSTNFAPQLITAWNPFQIKADLNMDGFSSGDNVYFYVFNRSSWLTMTGATVPYVARYGPLTLP